MHQKENIPGPFYPYEPTTGQFFVYLADNPGIKGTIEDPKENGYDETGNYRPCRGRQSDHI